MNGRELSPETLALHADAELGDARSVAPPIFETSTFKAQSAGEFVEMATVPRHPAFYTRYNNPNHVQVVAVVAALEGAESGMLFSSGMAAISTAVLASVRAGDHVVAPRQVYPGTAHLLEDVLPRFGVEVARVERPDAAAFDAASIDRTKLYVLETPSNPLLEITDLRAVAGVARSRGIRTIVDSTLGTPINQQPLALGIDVVMHSATKYLGGHSDVIAGIVLGSRALIDSFWHTSIVLGGTSGPIEAWLILRGLRTLALRVERHNRNAQMLAEFLAQHRAVERVHYPGLQTHPQHEIARRQMRGYGGVLSFTLRGGYASAEAFMGKVKRVARAASLGGVESLAAHAASMWAGSLSEAQMSERGIDPGLVRLSVGIDAIEDVIDDVGRALG
ncbi:MAG: PLP-dependent transferase [Candidatus Eremiobacteraeota bacterium]|nr:PLP-dependent transferase [Candidatus Eremiobacteraeota bacterium]